VEASPLGALVEACPVGVMVLIAVDGTPEELPIRYVNKAAVSMLGGRSAKDLEGQRFLDLVPVSSRAEFRDWVSKVLERRGAPVHRMIDGRALGGAGSPPRTLEVHGQWLELNGSPAVQIQLADVTQEVDAEQALRDSQERLRLSFDSALVGMLLVSLQSGTLGRLLQVNSALCDFMGYSEPELLQMTFADLAHPDDSEWSWSAIRSMASGELTTVRAEKRFRRSDGSSLWGLLSSAAVRDRRGTPVYAVTQIEDITSRKEAEARLTHQALHDSLTGLANRLLLHDHLTLALARAQRTKTRVGVFFLDLDDFKTINDSLGHRAGDELLVEVGRRLAGASRGSDLVARLGGDEFVLVCEDLASPQDAPEVARRLLSGLEEQFRVRGHDLAVTASVGVALSGPGSRTDDLLRDADAAMYRAKNRGKARWEIGGEGMHVTAARLLEVESGLRAALANGELELHYQPVIDLTTGEVVAVEALLRWRHPQRGLLLPREFLDVAEERRLIVPIGAWALEQACAQALDWQDRFGARAPTVAVNVSSRQIGDLALVTQIHEEIKASKLDLEKLCLEITERQVIDVARSGAAELLSLAGLGVQLAVDDFGTGYAGFEYLRQLPVNVLKIDQSFVDGLGQDRTDTAITRSVIALGRSLDLTVIAEGVENQSQCDLLKEYGCPLGQGWLWRPAVPAQEIDALLQNGVSGTLNR
jgi:diguanylate cyclase (GGDEF)-like protein/PAS domain S-box-containing protein